ncbi:polysaccharide deacetylase [Pyrenophora seminiperda CCB06]|uniref:Polysaccharide deacetylase n=1 Tax=Pyrenophora seminiperda CCB06 TaxID=1302712 RepID=A0A3M7M3K0_9PLEO|nr:polysaccharide deacetylase [Pyrenophora seminiperda CCB06]
MRFSFAVAVAFVAPLAAAHGGMEGIPKIFGMPKHLRDSLPLAGLQTRHAEPARPFGPRQADVRCGPDNGNRICAQNECCSPAGYCGTTQDFCQAPDCLLDFGPACDANKVPAGASTRNDPRPKLGSVPYGGAGIYGCNDPGNVAITYDDGPFIYTEGVLQQFEARGAHATFFITGNNNGKGAIDEKWADVIKKMYDGGHQVASHTWSHQDLSKITKDQAYDQMVHNEMALRNIIGKYPTYMRPPYSSCNDQCQSVVSDLGYVVTYFDLDTDDYNHLNDIQVAKDNFKKGIDTRNDAPADGDRLAIGHDIHQQTAENLTVYMLEYLYSQGLKAVTVGECLQDPKENWYRDSTPAPPSNSTTPAASAPAPATPTGPTSKDGMCGATGAQQSCVGFVGTDGLLGECCSGPGFCGRTSDYCGANCQAGFGKCGDQPSSAPPLPAAVVSNSSTTGPVPNATASPTMDGACGPANGGKTCIGFVGSAGLSECCSQYGFCGNTNVYCAAGCQNGFGKCGAQSGGSAISPGASNATSAPPPTASASAVVPPVVSSPAAVSTANPPPPPSVAPSSTVKSTAAAPPSIPSSTFSTAVAQPSSPSTPPPPPPPPTKPPVSTNGKCGTKNGGQTCAGYKAKWGMQMECCNKMTGMCATGLDVLACGVSCEKGYGKCWW